MQGRRVGALVGELHVVQADGVGEGQRRHIRDGCRDGQLEVLLHVVQRGAPEAQ